MKEVNFYKCASLRKMFDDSESTAKRVCRFIRFNPHFKYKDDYIKVGNIWRYTAEAYIEASNERGKYEGV